MSSIRGRMLHGSISNSAKLEALSCDGARLMFTWLIAHCDNLGRIRAEPIQLKATVLPRNPATLVQITKWSLEMHESGLLQLYKAQGQLFMQVHNWTTYQRLHHNHASSSKLPAPPDILRSTSVQAPEHLRSTSGAPPYKGDREGEGEGEVESNTCTSAAPLSVQVDISPADPTPQDWFNESFWPAYPRRIARGRALKAFLAIARKTPKAQHDALAGRILEALERDALEFADRPPDKIPYPATWLNDRPWEAA